MLVYQHRPRRRWVDLFAELSSNLNYVHTAVAVHESTLAFIGMATNASAGEQLTAVFGKICGQASYG